MPELAFLGEEAVGGLRYQAQLVQEMFAIMKRGEPVSFFIEK